VRVQIKRRGGLAGVTLGAEVSTSDLDDETKARVEKAVARLIDTPANAAAPQPDRFHYEITVPEQGATVTVPEQELPDDLRPLIEMASKLGTIESGRKGPA
jgi:hypothetical protein